MALKALDIKIAGDKLLEESGIPGLSRRRLSAADATSIALADSLGAPIVTGDEDLSFVARKLGIDVVW